MFKQKRAPQIITRPVTETNWLAALALEVYPEQRDFTPTVAVSLAKAYIQPNGYCYDPVAVYADHVLVGFYSFVHDPSDFRQCYFAGFLIDKTQQGRGYGRATLLGFLQFVRRTYPECTDILLTVHPANQIAQHLYTTLGFVKTGDTIEGEDIMRCVLYSL